MHDTLQLFYSLQTPVVWCYWNLSHEHTCCHFYLILHSFNLTVDCLDQNHHILSQYHDPDMTSKVILYHKQQLSSSSICIIYLWHLSSFTLYISSLLHHFPTLPPLIQEDSERYSRSSQIHMVCSPTYFHLRMPFLCIVIFFPWLEKDNREPMLC